MDGMIYIRQIDISELYLFEDFLYDAIYVPEGKELFPRNIVKDPSISIYIDDFGNRSGDYCLIAEIDEKVAGAVWVRILDDIPKGYGNAGKGIPEFAISIHKERRKQKIGTMLMLAMIDYLKQQGYEKASLSVQKNNYARSLYLKLGFEVLEDRDDDLLMVLKFS